MKGIIPDEVLNRPKKGFGVPLARWLRQMPVSVSGTGVAGTKPAWVEARWEAARAGTEDERLLLWSWMSLNNLAGVAA